MDENSDAQTNELDALRAIFFEELDDFPSNYPSEDTVKIDIDSFIGVYENKKDTILSQLNEICEASKGGEVVNILVEKVRDLLKENQIKTFQLHDGKTKGKEKKSEKKSKKKEKQIAETDVNELGNAIEQHLSVEKEQSKGKSTKAEIEKKKIIVEEEEDEEDLQPFNEEEEELAEKMREEEEEREARELMDEAERKRKQGTPFSIEAFKLWKQRF
ncbi:MAG: hypothetical protein EZS28_038578, partial [Streblomastix strix]